MTAGAHSLRIGARVYPVVLPSIRDPRLHLAAVIITIHILGISVLGFRVSVPQIIAAILTCAVIEVVWTFRQSSQIVWPASAMLTGSGVALILRLVGMERGDIWSWQGWYLFAGVAGVSLLTKYWIRYRGSHVFNPSNVGLVAAFLVLGSAVIEPLDFWWAPLDPGMAAAYAVILVGGLLITARLGLLAMAAVFWVVLAAGLGTLAVSGHCMTAAWALQPVCGMDFWWVVVTSPEVLIFLFFMITDPKTIPTGRTARLVFAAALAVVCTLLIAPHTTEFGAKVGLLAGLVLLTPLRYLIDRVMGTNGERVWPGANTPGRLFAGGAAVGAIVVITGVGIVVAGTPARGEASTPAAAADTAAVAMEETSLPEVTVSRDAESLKGELDPSALAGYLAEDLAIEAEAMRRSDTSLLRAAADGERLVDMERRIEVAATRGEKVIPVYHFETLHLDTVFTDGPQGGASLGLLAKGDVETITYDAAGAETARTTEPFTSMFVMREGQGGRWLIVAEVSPPPSPGQG